jgi:ParB/RepB/Spo0J family partition protein
MQKLKEIVYVPVSKIVRDENQPRQYFDAVKLGRLSDSIKKLGVKEPLIVEGLADGTYKIVDGERRWRSAKAIGLKELPAIIERSLTPHDRIIEQFHIQEMREGWQADEKAIAIESLSQVLGVSFHEAGKLVGLPVKLVQAYASLMSLKERDTFLSHKLPVDRAQNIVGLVVAAKYQSRRQLNEEMEDSEIIALEKLLVHKLVSGEFTTSEDFRVLRDSFTKDANNIKKFLKGVSPAQLFKASDAGGVRAYRRLKTMMSNLSILIKEVQKSKDARLLLEEDRGVQAMIKSNVQKLNNLL